VNELVHVSAEVRAALDDGRPVVALETTIVAHGFPYPDGVEVGLAMEQAVRGAGATPATIGVADGLIKVGLSDDELARFDSTARKLGPRDLAACAVSGSVGATTVAGVLAVARAVGLRFMGTGGIGGVHRGYPHPPDVSADLVSLASAPVVVACSGAKSLLDIPATMEHLETLGIPVLGYRTDTLPLFYEAHGGPPVSQRVEDARAAARIAALHWQLGGCGLLLTNAPPETVEVEGLIEEATAEASRQAVSGQRVTPFVLAFLHERSGGRTREVNHLLAVANARLAGEVAVAFAAL
jgi:pseudouridine-5'-phosphate glycosidase